MPITRRALISAALATSTIQIAPTRAFGASFTQSWSSQATASALPIVHTINQHPFIAGLADGTLSRERFDFYLHQNVFYLDSYAQTLGAIAKRLNHQPHRQKFEAWQKDTIMTRDWTKDLLSRSPQSRPLEDSPCAEVELYRSYEARLACLGSIGEAIAVILPCFWVYEQVGLHIASIRKTKDNPYIEWIGAYGEPSYSQTVKQALGIADYYSKEGAPLERSAMTKAFVHACRMEALFFDAAWNLRRWPISVQ